MALPVHRDHDITDAFVAQYRRHRLGGVCFAVDDKGPMNGATQLADPLAQFVAVGVRGVTLQGFDFGVSLDVAAEDLDDFLAFFETPPQSLVRLIANEQNQVTVVADVVLQVVQLI